MDRLKSFFGREIIPRILLWHVHMEYKIIDKAADIVIKILKEDLNEMAKLKPIPANRNERAKDIIALRRFLLIIMKHHNKVTEYVKKYPCYLRYYMKATNEINEVYEEWIAKIKTTLKSEGVEC